MARYVRYTIEADSAVLCMGDVQDLIVAAVSHHVNHEYSGTLPAGITMFVNHADKTIVIEDGRAPQPRIDHASAVALRKQGYTNDQILQIALALQQAKAGAS